MIGLDGQTLATIAVASVVGSLHCAGMCGGFVAFYSGTDADPDTPPRWSSHLAYNGGRLLTYAGLGALAGTLGSAADIAGRAAGVGRIAALIAGSVMVLWGIGLLLDRLPRANITARLGRWMAKRLAPLRAQPPATRALILGLSSTLLPCGWLYAFAVSAAGTGGALSGSLVMVAFWLGTVPMMLGLGAGFQRVVRPLQRHIPWLSALGLLTIGLVTLSGRLDVSGRLQKIEQKTRAAGVQTQATGSPSSGDAPCCDGHEH